MRVGGLASGMDTEAIVRDMMKIQKMPLDKLTQKKTFTEWQQESVRETNLAFTNLRDSASSLRLQSSFNSYSATSSNLNSVAVATNANAVNGSYRVEVTSVASPAKMNSANAIEKAPGVPAKSTDTIGAAGFIKVVDKDGNEVEVEIESDMTYEKVAQALQDATANEDIKLRASFDNTTSRFFISSKGMGEDQNFTLKFTDSEGVANPLLANQVLNNKAVDPEAAATHTTTNATYGAVKFDGIEIKDLTVNQTTVNGLTLNLMQASDEITTINVKSNPEKPLEMIKGFVESYNKIIEDLEKKLVEKRYPDFQPLSGEQKKDMTDNEIELWEEKARSGLLRNDPILRNAIQDLRRAFMDEVKEIPDGNIKLLSQIGIDTRKFEGGKLFIDEKILSEKLTNNSDEVMQLFVFKDAAGNGVGVGDRVYAKLNQVVTALGNQAGKVTSAVDNSTLSKKIKQMDEDINRWQDRLTRIEDRYWRQFTAMEKAISQMNSQSSWMQQNMFGSM
ncbi:flagellar filament capping protein FliD [Metaplanococcus flavidus]|uniref:Flagellar hook-associated protein 2 n=1 Tax=Metaplanococcus flavidus TaxID=569883 RepID=A0ABW3LE31_9BACL